MAVDFASLAENIVAAVGGVPNIKDARHCATRLRFELADAGLADEAAVKQLAGVISVVRAGGQFQVVIGNDVPHVYARVSELVESGDSPTTDGGGGRKSILDRFIELVSGIMHPILWPLAGAGLYKAFLSLVVTLGWLRRESTEYIVMNAASDSIINFLPIVIAIPAAKIFKANQYTAMAVAGALVYPDIIALDSVTEPLTFFGIPLVMMSYVSSLLPIIVAVWLQGYLERFLTRVLPGVIRNFAVPLLVLLLLVPFVLLTIGPLTTIIATYLGDAVNGLFTTLPWLAGAIMGGFWQVFVIFGLHWGFVPIMLSQLDTAGFTLLTGPLLGAVMAQAASTLAVMIRTKDPETRKLAGPAALSGFLAGITEPAIYGVNLPRKLPFYFGIAGGAIGGIVAGLAGGRTTAFVFPSLVGIPAYLDTPNLVLMFIGALIAVIIAFLGTLFWGVKDTPPAEAADESSSRAAAVTSTILLTPVPGQVVALAEVPDPVFSSGSMGEGVGIVPSSSTIVAPADGTLAVAMGTGHAYGIVTDDGIELLVHIGVDTVNMGGEGFTSRVSKGDRVAAGQVLAEVDLAAIEAAGHPTTTILIVTNTADCKAVTPTTASAIDVGETAVTVTR